MPDLFDDLLTEQSDLPHMRKVTATAANSKRRAPRSRVSCRDLAVVVAALGSAL